MRGNTACLHGAAFRVFLAEKVDVAILEVGLGGRLDATNCVTRPVVCGVSALGFDHMELLGNTLRVRGEVQRDDVSSSNKALRTANPRL